MKKILAVLFFGFLANANAADIYKIDSANSGIIWSANHFGFSHQSGKLTGIEGTILIDEKSPQNSSIDVTIRTSSIATGNSKFDEDLKNINFLNSEKFGTATFKSSAVTPLGQSAKVRGSLVLLGITKIITLDVKLNKIGINPLTQQKTIGFTGTTTIKRSDFGMTFGTPEISDEVKITIDLEGNFISSENIPGAGPILGQSIAKSTSTSVAEWKINPSKSKLEFTGIQDVSTFNGSFRKFDGQILFDKNQLSKSKVVINIDTTSIDISFGDALTTLQGANWMGIQMYPKATFIANKFTALSNTNSYRAEGNLTIKDKTIPTSVDFSFTEYSATKATAIGRTIIKRSLFGIGDRDVRKANNVRDDVTVTFTVSAER